jgi:hypothetical protein
MSPRFKREYMETIYLRYKRASKRAEKSALITELCVTCNWHRKHAIRALKNFKRFTKPKPKKRGKPSVYNIPSVIEPLKRIWLTSGQPCSKLLEPTIRLWLPFYAKEFGGLPLNAVKALLKISPATIDRILKPVRIKYTKRGRSTTKPGTLLRKSIPIKTNQWDEFLPGFLEADTVAHCGDTVAGIYANTVNFVDIATGWTEQRAVWGKGETGVLEQIKDAETRLPFLLRGFDCDNGGEFINHHLIRHFGNKVSPVQFTRSRSYRKDDNAHVEQKNWTHVRQWFGYHRLDNQKVVPLMNGLYTSEWRLFHNFFCHSVKLIEKKRIASKTIKRYDVPKTPYQRVLESPEVSNAQKQALKEQFASLNPFRLRKAMEKKLREIFNIHFGRRNSYPGLLR